jgi:hypothetical protein
MKTFKIYPKGKGEPFDLVGQVLPSKFLVCKSVDNAITDRILERIRTDKGFDEAEAAFAEDLVSDHPKKYLRLRRVQQRAQVLLEAHPVHLIQSG